MKYLELLNKIETVLNDKNHSILNYNSLVEEAIKLTILAKNTDKPLIIVKFLKDQLDMSGNFRIFEHLLNI